MLIFPLIKRLAAQGARMEADATTRTLDIRLVLDMDRTSSLGLQLWTTVEVW